MGRSLSLQDFKEWMSAQSDLTGIFSTEKPEAKANDEHAGKLVQTKVSRKKLLERIETEDVSEVLVDDFVENGGTILCVEQKRVQVEVESGVFFIPKFCVKLIKD